MYREHSSVTDIGVVQSFILQQEGKRDVQRAQLCKTLYIALPGCTFGSMQTKISTLVVIVEYREHRCDAV